VSKAADSQVPATSSDQMSEAAEVSRILVVDDRPTNVKALRMRLESEGYVVLEALNGPDALRLVEAEDPDLVLLDVMMPGMDGYEVCRRLKKRQGNFLPVIMVTARTETEAVVTGLEAGADEYVTKPFEPLELLARVKSMLRIRHMYRENRDLRRRLAEHSASSEIVGCSQAMAEIYRMLPQVIEPATTVLLTGETGTGKETLAHRIHDNGPSREGRFVAINCGAIPESLVESELFGHRKGFHRRHRRSPRTVRGRRERYRSPRRDRRDQPRYQSLDPAAETEGIRYRLVRAPRRDWIGGRI